MSNRIEYQKEMKELHDRIIRMGSAVEEAIHKAIQALTEQNTSLAQSVIDNDDAIDQAEREINHACVLMIARQQPVARDLRDIAANMKLVTDLERIGDLAEDISEHVLFIDENRLAVTVPHDVFVLAELCRTVIRAALDAYVTRNQEKADHAIGMDTQINLLYDKLKQYLVYQMQIDPQNARSLVELLLICKHLERAADHAQNVAEWVVYYVRGQYAD